MSPGHPQSSVQKMAMVSRAREEIPVRDRKSQGSTTLVAVRSRVRKRPMSKSGGPHEEETATQTIRGSTRPVAVPT